MGTEDQKGHRDRLRQRFITNGSLDGFAEHEIIEMLLFYALPRRDTKPLAYKILNEFGNLHNLLEATTEEISVRCKISKNTAMLFPLFNNILKKSLQSKYKEKSYLGSYDKLGEYAVGLMYGDTVENFYMICLDRQLRLICNKKVAIGTIDKVQVYARNIVSVVIGYNVSYVALAHNHPSGILVPSRSDIDMTNEIIEILDGIEVDVIDHIVVGGHSFFSFAEKRLLGLRYPETIDQEED